MHAFDFVIFFSKKKLSFLAKLRRKEMFGFFVSTFLAIPIFLSISVIFCAHRKQTRPNHGPTVSKRKNGDGASGAAPLAGKQPIKSVSNEASKDGSKDVGSKDGASNEATSEDRSKTNKVKPPKNKDRLPRAPSQKAPIGKKPTPEVAVKSEKKMTKIPPNAQPSDALPYSTEPTSLADHRALLSLKKKHKHAIDKTQNDEDTEPTTDLR